jgi:hypothetical protein
MGRMGSERRDFSIPKDLGDVFPLICSSPIRPSIRGYSEIDLWVERGLRDEKASWRRGVDVQRPGGRYAGRRRRGFTGGAGGS